jgi:hypothetical protein
LKQQGDNVPEELESVESKTAGSKILRSLDGEERRQEKGRESRKKDVKKREDYF